MYLKDEIEKRIKKEYTVEALINELNISVEELYLNILELRKSNKYYYPNIQQNCEIILSKKKEQLDSDICLSIPDGDFAVLFISDPHVGSIYDAVDRFRAIEDFANTDKYNIKMIVNTGDLIDGPDDGTHSVARRLPELEDQLQEFIMQYIYFKGPNVCVLGSPKHDTSGVTVDGYNLYRSIKEFRPDLKVYGSATGAIKFRHQNIILCHDVSDKNVQSRITDDSFVFSGHSHIYYNHTFYGEHGPVIRIVNPSMSNLPLHNNTTPGFLKVIFRFNNYQMTNVLIDNYTFEGATSHILHNGQISYDIPYRQSEANAVSRKRKRK